jgi:hypothetical protein
MQLLQIKLLNGKLLNKINSRVDIAEKSGEFEDMVIGIFMHGTLLKPFFIIIK